MFSLGRSARLCRPPGGFRLLGFCAGTAAFALAAFLVMPTSAAPSDSHLPPEFIPLPDRADRGLIFSTDQGAPEGSRVNFVDTARGNLSFLWVDGVLEGEIPILLGRAYDSASREI